MHGNAVHAMGMGIDSWLEEAVSIGSIYMLLQKLDDANSPNFEWLQPMHPVPPLHASMSLCLSVSI